ncbi:MAG: hypothetical protein AAFR76_01990 [Planctomycetota bacterium]
MTGKSFRTAVRAGHIVLSLVLGTYLYSPWSENPAFTAITLYVVFPLMALSGVALWKQAIIMRWIKRS